MSGERKMKISKEWLSEKGACSDGMEWFLKQKETDVKKICNNLIKQNQLSWANWLVSRAMNHSQQIQYAIYAAEQVIGIFEKEYPKDDRPRKAIEAAKEYLKNPTKENRDAADAAANAAYAAAYAAADAADAAANAAAYAAYAAYAANAADAAANAAVNAAADAASYAAESAMKIKIIKHGLKILGRKP